MLASSLFMSKVKCQHHELHVDLCNSFLGDQLNYFWPTNNNWWIQDRWLVEMHYFLFKDGQDQWIKVIGSANSVDTCLPCRWPLAPKYTIWLKVCTRRAFHSKIMGINMELVPLLQLQQLPLFWEGFPLDVGTLLWGLASIQPQEHLWGRALMLGD